MESYLKLRIIFIKDKLATFIIATILEALVKVYKSSKSQ